MKIIKRLKFDINTISILEINTIPISLVPWRLDDGNEYYTAKITGKYVGGKRWKRGKIVIDKSQLRQIKLNNVV